MLLKLEELLKFHENNISVRFKISVQNEEYAIALCTPIMQRTLELPQCSEIMFVDATGNCDNQNHKVYFFVTQSAAGGLPVGCIISSSQKSEIFELGVKGLLEILKIKINPCVILTDDDLAERNVLHKYWPESKLLLCTFHVLKACWRWLLMTKNAVLKEKTQQYYVMFKNILYSKTSTELESSKQYFFDNCDHENFKKYVKNMLTRIQEWALFYRQNLPLRGTDTNNYTEVMFRLLKDIPLERTKAFNVTQLADFIVTSFESYYKQRILDLIFGRESKVVTSRYLKNYDTNCKVMSTNLDKMEFNAQSEKNNKIIYKVDMICCKCTCPVGFNGKYCKHQAVVIKNYNILTVTNNLCTNAKLKLYEIATGKNAPERIFFPLQDAEMAEPTLECPLPLTASKPSENQIASENEKIPINKEVCLPSENENEILRSRWLTYSNNILTKLEQDPQQFYPAVKAHLDNVEKYAQTTSSLISGMYTSFKYKGISSKNRNSAAGTRRKGNKISVQLTSAARRKMGGKKTFSGRKSVKNNKKKKVAAHCLKTCIKKNVGLGGNKSKK